MSWVESAWTRLRKLNEERIELKKRCLISSQDIEDDIEGDNYFAAEVDALLLAKYFARIALVERELEGVQDLVDLWEKIQQHNERIEGTDK